MLAEELSLIIETIQQNAFDENRISISDFEDYTPYTIYPTLSAFANQRDGGIIIFGIDVISKRIEGITDVETLCEKITEQCAQMSPVVSPHYSIASIESKQVVSAEIQECSTYEKPCFYKGAGKYRGSYLRVDGEDTIMSAFEIYTYDAFRESIVDDLSIIQRAGIESFNKSLLSQYLDRLRAMKPHVLQLDDQHTLDLQGVTQEGKPTICGLMMFGIYPQAYFPNLCIAVSVYRESNESIENQLIEYKKIEGTIPQILSDTLSFIKQVMKRNAEIKSQNSGSHTPQYPSIAVREIVLNALIHRDYSKFTRNKPIDIHIYQDHLVIESPGTLYGGISIEELGSGAVDIRNPHLASAVEILMNSDSRFSGIPITTYSCNEQGLPRPLFQEDRETFKVTLFCSKVGESGHTMSNTEIDILRYCHKPRGRAAIAREFGYTQAYIIAEYINPLVRSGLLALTMPEVPKSKNQQYLTKER